MSAYLHTLRLDKEAWHGQAKALGQGFIQPGEIPSYAASICGMDQYRYYRDSLFRMLREGNVTRNDDGTITISDATMKPVGKAKLGVEKPDGTRLAINRIVDWYDILQPADLVRILDPLADQMQLVGLGILGKDAEIMYVQFELPSYAIGGEEHRAFYTVGDDKKGGGVHQGTNYTNVVCANTWAVASGELPVFGHSDAAFTIDACAKVMSVLLQQREREKDLMNALFQRRFEKAERNAYAEAVFPDPVKPAKVELAETAMATLPEAEAEKIAERMESRKQAYEVGLDLAESRRLHLLTEVQKFNDDNTRAKGSENTGYALFNGLTAMARPHMEVRDVEGRKMFAGDEVNRLANALFGKGVNGLAVTRGRNWLAQAVNFK